MNDYFDKFLDKVSGAVSQYIDYEKWREELGLAASANSSVAQATADRQAAELRAGSTKGLLIGGGLILLVGAVLLVSSRR